MSFKADTIFFDKDGTLLDFDIFWVDVVVRALHTVFDCYNFPADVAEPAIAELLSELGIIDGETDIDGAVCKGTYTEIAEIIFKKLCSLGCTDSFENARKQIVSACGEHAKSAPVKPTCEDIRTVLLKLKQCGKHLCVVTTDNPKITAVSLKMLGIDDLFDEVYTDDGVVTPKPSAESIENYIEKTGASRDSIIMVGDTMTDVNFARNAGISVIGVGKEKNRAKLAAAADVTIPDISRIFDVLEV